MTEESVKESVRGRGTKKERDRQDGEGGSEEEDGEERSLYLVERMVADQKISNLERPSFVDASKTRSHRTKDPRAQIRTYGVTLFFPLSLLSSRSLSLLSFFLLLRSRPLLHLPLLLLLFR